MNSREDDARRSPRLRRHHLHTCRRRAANDLHPDGWYVRTLASRLGQTLLITDADDSLSWDRATMAGWGLACMAPANMVPLRWRSSPPR